MCPIKLTVNDSSMKTGEYKPTPMPAALDRSRDNFSLRKSAK